MDTDLLKNITRLVLVVDNTTRRIEVPLELVYLFPRLLDTLIYHCRHEGRGDLTQFAFDFEDLADGETLDMMINYAHLFHNKASHPEFRGLLDRDQEMTAKLLKGFDVMHSNMLTIHAGLVLRHSFWNTATVARIFNRPIWSNLISFFFSSPVLVSRNA